MLRIPKQPLSSGHLFRIPTLDKARIRPAGCADENVFSFFFARKIFRHALTKSRPAANANYSYKQHIRVLAPAVGFEPTTNRLTADRSTTELRWIAFVNAEHTLASPFTRGKRRFRYKRRAACAASFRKSWLRGLDLNQRPSGYEPDELPGCSTPRT